MLVDLLADKGIRLDSYKIGTQTKTHCPQPECRSHRRTDRPLSVKIDSDGAVLSCHHCGWTDYVLEPLRDDGKPAASPRVTAAATVVPAVPARIEWAPEPLPGDAYAYLHGRGISMEVADRYGVGWHRRGFLMFPFREEPSGAVVNIKFRSLVDKQFFQSKGGKKTYFGLDVALSAGGETLFVVEGELDALSCAEAGIAAVSVPDGAPKQLAANPSEQDLKFLFIANSYERVSKAFKKIVIAVDNDAPGLVLREELARRYGKDRCDFVEWPEGCKDANDVLVQHGPERLAEILKNPTPFPIANLRRFSNFSEQIDKFYASDDPRGVSTGFGNLDEFYTIRPGEVTVVTGVPGCGKSTFLNQLLVNLAALNDYAFGMCSFETPEAEHAAQLMEQYIRKPFFPGHPHRMTPDELEEAKRWIDAHFFLIGQDGPGGATVEAILEAARGAVARHNIRGLVIDPYTYIVKGSENRTDFVASFLTRLHAFAKLYQVHVWVVAHPAKLYRKDKTGEFPIPDLYDISDSAAWYNYPDCGMVVVCRADGGVEIHVKKVRFRAVGKKGVAHFSFDLATGTYEEAFGVDENA